MEKIPNEMLLNIVSFLSVPDLAHYAKTNRKSQSIVKTEVNYRVKKYNLSQDLSYKQKLIRLKFIEDIAVIRSAMYPDVSLLDTFGFQMLWEEKELMKNLLRNGWSENDINRRTIGLAGGSSLILDYAKKQNLNAMKILFWLGANPNQQSGRDLYHLGTFSETPEMMAFALWYGLDITLADGDIGESTEDILSTNPELTRNVLKLLHVSQETIDRTREIDLLDLLLTILDDEDLPPIL